MSKSTLFSMFITIFLSPHQTSSHSRFPRWAKKQTRPSLWLLLFLLGIVSMSASEWATPSLAQTAPNTGSLHIRKVVEPNSDNTEFSFRFVSSFRTRTFSLANGEERIFATLPAGTGYSVTETVPDGWALKSATCDNGNSPDNITIGTGKTVICTFRNVKAGKLIVNVLTQPNDDQSTAFAFSASGGLSPSSFSLKNTQERVFTNLAASRYGLSQTLPDGWITSSATCSNGDPINKIDVGPGETVACTFVNKQLGRIIVSKVTNPNPDRTASTFSFTTEDTLTPKTFSLKNDEKQFFVNVMPGTGYRIRELPMDGWELAGSSCDNNSSLSNIRVDPGQTVRCTFTNRGTQIDLTLQKDDGDITAEPGDTIVYTLRYGNRGTQAAKGVVLAERVPENTTFVASPSVATLWDCSDNAPAGTLCHYTIGSLAGEAEGQVEFYVKVADSLPNSVTTIENQATLSYTGNNSAVQSSTTTPVKGSTMLVLNKDDDGVSVSPGETILYTLDYANVGNQSVVGVRIRETVPLHTTFVATDQSWSCPDGSPAGTECVHQIIALGAGASGTVPFQVRVNSRVPSGVSVISNQATIGSLLTPDVDTGTEQTELQAAPDLAANIDDKGITVSPGGRVHYNVAYANVGVQAATGVLVTATLPGQTAFVANESTAGWSCNGNQCTFAVGTLASGASENLEWTIQLARPIAADSQKIVATVAVTDDGNNGSDPDLLNNTAKEETEIVDPGLVIANKAATLVVDQNDDGKIAPGDTVEYLIAIENQRGSAVRNVVFSDTLSTSVNLLPELDISQGTILSGEERNDRYVQVDLGTIAADSNATIRFRVMVQLPVPHDVVEVTNQGTVTSRDFATMVTDDPTSEAEHDPTVSPLFASSLIEMTLADFLLIDANGDSLVSVGDTLIYRLIARNLGDAGSPTVQVRVPLADNVVLNEESVTTTRGVVRAGNDPADRIVRVDVGELAGRSDVRITFQVQIIPTSGATVIQHQAVAVDTSVGGQSIAVSDDPDTASPIDATVTALNQVIVNNYPLYLPLIHK